MTMKGLNFLKRKYKRKDNKILKYGNSQKTQLSRRRIYAIA